MCTIYQHHLCTNESEIDHMFVRLDAGWVETTRVETNGNQLGKLEATFHITSRGLLIRHMHDL